MSIQPLIGITGGVLDDAGPTPGNHRSYVNEAYVTAVKRNGGLPVIIPVNYAPETAAGLVARLDGLVFSGGQDVDPAFYHQEPHQKLGETWPTRDRFELALLEAARAAKKPVLAICRGLQLVNVAYGGTLYQDLSELAQPTLKHLHYRHPYEPVHQVTLTSGSQLAHIFGTAELRVNSMHHQVVKEVGKGLVATATAADGVIEALEAPADRLLAVQWHPEEMATRALQMNQLFTHLIKEAAQ